MVEIIMKKGREAKILYNLLVALTILLIIGLSIFMNDASQQSSLLTGAVVGIQIPEDGLNADNFEENQSLPEISPFEIPNPIKNANAEDSSTENINIEERSINPKSASGRSVIRVFGGSGSTAISPTNIPNPWDYGVNLTTLQIYFRNALAPNQAVQFQVQHQGNTRFINYQAQNAGNTAAIISGNKITYPDAYSGVNVTYTVYSHKLTKEIFVVNESSMRNFTFKIQFDGVTYNKTAVGSINFFDEATADRLWTIDAPYAFDSSVNESNVSQSLPKNVSVYYDIRQAGVNYFIDLIINETNLSRFTYPVVIDPTTQSGCGTLNTAGETYILNQSINTTGTCFTIGASHLILDGAGFNITGNGSGSGVLFSVTTFNNVTIQNFGNISNFNDGIQVRGTNNIVKNNVIQGVVGNGIYIAASGDGVTIFNNTITGNSNNGVDSDEADYGNYTSNTLAYNIGGIVMSGNHNYVDNNTANNNQNDGIEISGTSINNTIIRNNVYSNFDGIDILSVTGANNTISHNTIYSNTDNGIEISGGGNKVINNTVYGHLGSLDAGIEIDNESGDSNLFDGNTVYNNKRGIAILVAGPENNLFVNNNVSNMSGEEFLDLSNSTYYNSLIYNNSFGQINWNMTNLTTAINLSVGVTIFLENNTVGLIDSANMLNLNSTTTIEIRQLSYTIAPQLFKSGVRCDNTDSCNITSYSSATGILVAVVSSFSNYSTGDSCGNLNTDKTLAASITTTGTCFIINASNIVIDGTGFNITGNGSGNGIDNSGGFDNITIKNFAGVNNFTKGIAATGGMVNSTIWNNTFSIANVSSSFGIDLLNGKDNNISNNIIIIPGASSFGIEVQASNNNTFMFNNITASGGITQAIRLNNAKNNTISFNNLTTHGSSSSGILFLSTSTNNTITSNSIYTAGSSAVAILFSSTGGDNTVFSNNITTIAGSSAHGIRATDGTGRQNITSNTIRTSGSGSFGISLEASTSSYLIFSNTLTVMGSSTRGISVTAANYHLVQENLINVTSSSSLGIQIDIDSNHTRVISNTIITNTTGSDGIYFRQGINNTVVNGTITTSVGNNILVLNGTGTLINVSFEREISFNAGATGSITVQWYLDVNVTNQSSAPLQNANVTTYNVSGLVVDTQSTAANGAVSRLTLTESVRNSSVTIFSTPHFINATLAGYSSNSTTINLTQINSTTVQLILQDNIAPNLTILSPVNNRNYSIRSSNQTFNVSIFDVSTVSVVYLWFDNGTGTDVNVTAVNQSGNWIVSYNVSTLAEERQGVRIVANDTLNNVNNTFVINFTVDFASPNVTLNFLNNPVDNSNFSIRSSNKTFNASVFDSLTSVQNVYFWFDNGTGKDFNITGTNRSGQWSASYNVSTLAEERQGVRIIANDTVNNVNNTFVINFTIDRTAPTINITTPTASSTLTGSRAFNATVSDNLLEINTVLFQFSNGTNPFNRTASNSSGTWNVSVDTTTIAEGALTVTVFANDTVGNMNNSQTLSLTIDNVAEAASAAPGGGGGGGGTSSGAVIKKPVKEEAPEEAPEEIEEKVSEEELPPVEEEVPQILEEAEIISEKSLFAKISEFLSLGKLSNIAGKVTASLRDTLREHPAAYTGIFTVVLVAILIVAGLVFVHYKSKMFKRTKMPSEKNRVEISLLKKALSRLQKLRKLYKLRKKDTSAIEQNIQRKKKRLRELRGW